MTQLYSSFSHSSSKTSSPLDLASGLVARLQMALFLPSATDCAVLLDSEALGVSVPSLLLSLAEKNVVSLTKVCILRLMAIMTRFNWCNQVSQILKRNRF